MTSAGGDRPTRSIIPWAASMPSLSEPVPPSVGRLSVRWVHQFPSLPMLATNSAGSPAPTFVRAFVHSNYFTCTIERTYVSAVPARQLARQNASRSAPVIPDRRGKAGLQVGFGTAHAGEEETGTGGSLGGHHSDPRLSWTWIWTWIPAPAPAQTTAEYLLPLPARPIRDGASVRCRAGRRPAAASAAAVPCHSRSAIVSRFIQAIGALRLPVPPAIRSLSEPRESTSPGKPILSGKPVPSGEPISSAETCPSKKPASHPSNGCNPCWRANHTCHRSGKCFSVGYKVVERRPARSRRSRQLADYSAYFFADSSGG